MKSIEQFIDELAEDLEEATLGQQTHDLARFFHAVAEAGDFGPSAIVNACVTMIAITINELHPDRKDADDEAKRAADHLKAMVAKHHDYHRSVVDMGEEEGNA